MPGNSQKQESGPVLAPTSGMTLRQAVCAARDQFASMDDLAPTARQDAELLLLHTLSLPRTTIYAYPGRLLNAREEAAFAAAVARRLKREPVQYITGVQEFYGLALTVTPAVLIPRPETELLVEAALNRLPEARLPQARLPRESPLHIADVGTGSGAIAIAIASRLPQVCVTALDLSAAALAIARQNAARHDVADRINFLKSDLFSAIPAGARPFDAILANPPYIPDLHRASLHPQVRDFEPAAALFAGASGLSIYERLIPEARRHLAPAGLLAMEIGAGQRDALTRLLRSWHAVQFLDDLQGIPRVVLARRP